MISVPKHDFCAQCMTGCYKILHLCCRIQTQQSQQNHLSDEPLKDKTGLSRTVRFIPVYVQQIVALISRSIFFISFKQGKCFMKVCIKFNKRFPLFQPKLLISFLTFVCIEAEIRKVICG